MRDKFLNWLNNYKGFSIKKAENLVATIDNLSNMMVVSDEETTHLFTNYTFIDFAKNRKRLFGFYDCSASEKKALELYGDFLQVLEISHIQIQIPDEGKLYQSIKRMRMQYSYKAVLLMSLINRGFVSTLNTITEDFQSYYQMRINNNMTSEREQSVFSAIDVDFDTAKRVIATNPLKVLCDANIIIYKKDNNILALASEYLPLPEELPKINTLLLNRLEAYYQAIVYESRIPNELEDAMNVIATYIESEADSELCKETFIRFREQVKILYAGKKHKRPTRNHLVLNKTIEQIGEDDGRKVGKLVRESMTALSEAGYVFNEEQLALLLDKAGSKKLFNINYPFFREYDPLRPINDQRKDYNNEGRYWSALFAFGNKQYLITSEWYIGDRHYFIEWFNDIISRASVRSEV